MNLRAIWCALRGHTFFKEDMDKCRPGHPIHTICDFCNTLYEVRAVYDGLHAGYDFRSLD